jgi:hypothetical protein
MKIVGTHTPGIASFENSGQLLVVLTQDEIGQYAAYKGIIPNAMSPAARPRYASIVAHGGTKMSWKECVEHFPNVSIGAYRS